MKGYCSLYEIYLRMYLATIEDAVSKGSSSLVFSYNGWQDFFVNESFWQKRDESLE